MEIILKNVYKKYLKGTRLTDAELDYVIEVVPPLRDGLSQLGERFHFQWNELRKFYDDCDFWRDNRKLAKMYRMPKQKLLS